MCSSNSSSSGSSSGQRRANYHFFDHRSALCVRALLAASVLCLTSIVRPALRAALVNLNLQLPCSHSSAFGVYCVMLQQFWSQAQTGVKGVLPGI